MTPSGQDEVIISFVAIVKLGCWKFDRRQTSLRMIEERKMFIEV